MALIYAHITEDTNKVFYIGIGSKKRSNQISNRSKFWKSINSKHKRRVIILVNNIEWNEACELEKYLISKFGRRDLNEGYLVNHTDGGEGSLNRTFKHSNETKLKMSNSHKNKIVSIKTRKKQSEANSKIVINTLTKKIYISAKEAAINENIVYSTLVCKLCNLRKNNTNLEYLN